MSDNNPNVENKKEIKNKEQNIDEFAAYNELCQIIAFAIQTQNAEGLTQNINAWKKKYNIKDLKVFSPYYKSRIEYILSAEYLSLVIANYMAVVSSEKFQESKEAFENLSKIITKSKHAKSFEEANKPIKKWEKENPGSGLSRLYAKRTADLIRSFRIDFVSKEAYENLEKIIEDTKNKKSGSENYTNVKESLNEWSKKYPLKDWTPKYEDKIKSLTEENYLEEITGIINHETALQELNNILDAYEHEKNFNLLCSNIECWKLDYPLERFHPTFNTSRVETLISTSYINSLFINSPIKAINHGNSDEEFVLNRINDILKSPNNHAEMLNFIMFYRDTLPNFSNKEKILFAVQSRYPAPNANDLTITSSQIENSKLQDCTEINAMRKTALCEFFAMLSNNKPLSNTEKESLSEITKLSITAEIIEYTEKQFEESTNIHTEGTQYEHNNTTDASGQQSKEEEINQMLQGEHIITITSQIPQRKSNDR